MFHYFVSIKCENTTNGLNKAKDGLVFNGTCIAKDNEDALKQATSMAETMWETMFKEFAPTLFVKGSMRLYPMLNKPHFIIEVSKESIVSKWGDCHNENLRNAINEIWANDGYRKRLVPIIRSYYERDCEDLANFYDNECVWWQANEVSFDKMVEMVSFESLCEVMFAHIFDDADYKAIINYIRPKLSFTDWWELV